MQSAFLSTHFQPGPCSAQCRLPSVAENIAVLQAFPVYIGYSASFFQCILAAVQALLQYTAGTSCTLHCRGFGRCSLGWFLNPVLAPLHLPANHFYPGTNNQHLLVFCFRLFRLPAILTAFFVDSLHLPANHFYPSTNNQQGCPGTQVSSVKVLHCFVFVLIV